MLLRVGVFLVALALVSVLGLPWELVAVAAASFIAGAFTMGLMRASAAGDRQMEMVRVEEPPANGDADALTLRVRRASSRWPLTELDPIERAAFAGAVEQAHDFDDLDLPWQELILAAEHGAARHTYELDLPLR